MHRSGTSLTAQWINSCGLFLGEHLLGKNFSNIHGHFEDIDFINFHEAQLIGNQINTGGLNLPATLDVDNLDFDETSFMALIERRNKTHEEWGFKDPRTCLFLHKMPKIDNAKYMVLYRNPHEVAQSLVRREKKRVQQNYYLLPRRKKPLRIIGLKKRIKEQENLYDQYLKDWVIYNNSILKFLDNIPSSEFIVVNSDKLSISHKRIFNWLTNHNFHLNQIAINEVFDDKIYTYDSNSTQQELSNEMQLILEQFSRLENTHE